MSNPLPSMPPGQPAAVVHVEPSSSLLDRISTWVSENKAVVYTIAGVAVVVTGAGAIYYLNSDSVRATKPPQQPYLCPRALHGALDLGPCCELKLTLFFFFTCRNRKNRAPSSARRSVASGKRPSVRPPSLPRKPPLSPLSPKPPPHRATRSCRMLTKNLS